MSVRLAILIPSLECREDMFIRLLAELQRQQKVTSGCVVLYDVDDGEVTIGQKRNRLLERAKEHEAEYVVSIDDDDIISDTYLSSITKALDSGPDAVGFRSERYRDGRLWANCTYSAKWPRESAEVHNGGIVEIRRWPCHLTPVRTKLAPNFKPWNFDEDRSYAAELKPKIRREFFVDEVLYKYMMRNRADRQAEKVHPNRWNESHRPKTNKPLHVLY